MIVGPSDDLVHKYFWRMVDHAAEQGYDIVEDIAYPEYFKMRANSAEEPFTKHTPSQCYLSFSLPPSVILSHPLLPSSIVDVGLYFFQSSFIH